MTRKFFVISLAIGLLTGFFMVNFAAAANDAAGLTVSPPLKEVSIKAGEKFQDVIKITNPTSNDLVVQITTQDFKARGEEGQQDFTDASSDNASYSLAKWITVQDKFSIKPSETKEISYTINAPKNAENGGHYGVIFFAPDSSSAEKLKSSGATAIPKIGTLILATVPGVINYDGKIAEFKSNKSLYIESTNIIDLATRFQNLGNTHVKPAGNITIKNAFGKEVAKLTVNEKEGNVLPQSIRKFSNEWSKKYGFGWYKANANLTYGDGQKVAASLMFWIIPWKETAGAIIIIIVLIWIAKHIEWKKKK